MCATCKRLGVLRMKTLYKQPELDFRVLNLTDTQLSDEEWADGHPNRNILEHTIAQLVERVQPQLITLSGDLAWANHEYSYEMLAKYIDGFGIPWAPVWGNHDNQGGAEAVDRIVEKYLTYENCVYEKGEPAYGNGNYVIMIEENAVPVAALLMLDSHDRETFIDENGEEQTAWAKLTEPQIEWLGAELARLKASGCRDVTVVMHIPIYAYRDASKAAYKEGVDLSNVTLQLATGPDVWNEGYTDSIGVQHEDICSYVHDDGVLEILKRSEIVHHVLCGHDHINNWKIPYEGIRLMYALKTGAGCYWNPLLNGGTVLKINHAGVYDVEDVFVDVSHLIKPEKVDS